MTSPILLIPPPRGQRTVLIELRRARLVAFVHGVGAGLLLAGIAAMAWRWLA